MLNTELKAKVKEKVDSIEQSYLLEEILQLIEIETVPEDVFIIPESHKQELEKSLIQMEKGQIISNALVNKGVAKWLLS